MFDSITPQMHETLDRMCALATTNPNDARIAAGIAQLKQTASAVLAAAAPEPEPMIRNAAGVVADGLLAAAAICGKLQEQ